MYLIKTVYSYFESHAAQVCCLGSNRHYLIEAEWYIYALSNYSYKQSLVQIMACSLTSVKPLSEPMLEYC